MDARTADGPPPFPLSLAPLMPIGMLVVGWLGTPLVAVVPVLPTILVTAGLPYAVVALAAGAILRLRAARETDPGPLDELLTTGEAFSQRATRAVAGSLLVLWLILAVALGLQVAPGTTVAAGGPLIVGALVSIAANARLLYSPRAARAEVGAVRSGGAARRRVLTGWILAPLSWFAFAVPAPLLEGLVYAG